MLNRLAGWTLAFTLLILMPVPAAAQLYDDTISVSVMFDFGDGSVLWHDALLEDNRTAILATELAASHLGLHVETRWFPFGAFVEDIGDRDPVYPLWWHLLLWNETTSKWELASLGASEILLAQGDIIGWFLAEDDPPWPGTVPLATPAHPYPITSFRGDLANSGFTNASIAKVPSLAWSFDLDGAEISASPVAAKGVVYQVTWNGTYALDIESRELIWQVEAVAGISTPAILSGDLVVGSRDGRLYRLKGDTGEVVWSVLLQAGAQFTGIASSPKLYSGRAFVGTFNESGGPGRLLAVNLTNGALVWSVETGSIHMSSPAVQGGRVYVGVMGLFDGTSLTWGAPYGLLSVGVTDGGGRWFYPTDGPVASSPVVAEGIVYFTSRDGYLYGVTMEGSLAFREEIGPSTSSPAVRGDMVFAASGILGTEGRVVAFDIGLGRLWEFTPNGPVQGSVTLAGTLVLVATNAEEGTVYALRAADGMLEWSFTPEPSQYILSTPVVVDGLVLVPPDSGLLFAIGEAPLGAGLDPVLVYSMVGVGGGAVVVVAALIFLRRRSG